MRLVNALLLMLVGCIAVVPDSARTPVRRLVTDTGSCSCVVVGPEQAYTAAHCLGPVMLVNGERVLGHAVGPDLAVLEGTFLPPYATSGRLVTEDLILEGYGCSGRDEARPARLVVYQPGSQAYSGLEIAFLGRACPGDSGGALWGRDGLVGVITAYATHDPGLGFGTPVPASL